MTSTLKMKERKSFSPLHALADTVPSCLLKHLLSPGDNVEMLSMDTEIRLKMEAFLRKFFSPAYGRMSVQSLSTHNLHESAVTATYGVTRNPMIGKGNHARADMRKMLFLYLYCKRVQNCSKGPEEVIMNCDGA